MYESKALSPETPKKKLDEEAQLIVTSPPIITLEVDNTHEEADGNAHHVTKSRITFAKEILVLGIPLVAVDLIEAAGNFSLNIIISRSDKNAASVLSLITITKSVALTLGGSILTPMATMIAKEYGDNNKFNCGSILQQGWVIGTLASLPIMICLWAIEPILLIFKQSSNLTPLVGEYFLPYAFAVTPKLWNMSDYYFLSSTSKQNILIPWSVVTIGTGIACNYVIIYGLGPIPALGFFGSGLASVIEAYMSRIILSAYYSLNRDFSEYRLSYFRIRQTIKELIRILKLGYPITLLSAVLVATSFIQSMMIGWLGGDRLAVDQAAVQYMILFGPLSAGLARASGIYIARSLGNKYYHLIRKYNENTILMQVALGSIPLIAFSIIPMQLARLFLGDNSNVNLDEMETTIRVTYVVNAIGQILYGISNTCTNSLQGLYDTLFPSLLNIIVTLAVVLPLPYLLAFIFKWDLIGLDVGINFGSVITASVLFYRWYQKSTQKELIKLSTIESSGNDISDTENTNKVEQLLGRSEDETVIEEENNLVDQAELSESERRYNNSKASWFSSAVNFFKDTTYARHSSQHNNADKVVYSLERASSMKKS